MNWSITGVKKELVTQFHFVIQCWKTVEANCDFYKRQHILNKMSLTPNQIQSETQWLIELSPCMRDYQSLCMAQCAKMHQHVLAQIQDYHCG